MVVGASCTFFSLADSGTYIVNGLCRSRVLLSFRYVMSQSNSSDVTNLPVEKKKVTFSEKVSLNFL